MHLPEPASLQDGEGAAQQLQDDVSSMENLHKSNECLSKDSIEQKLMHSDIQHAPAMKMVEKKKPYNKRDRYRFPAMIHSI